VSAADLAEAGGEEIAVTLRARLHLLRAAAILGVAEGAARLTRDYAGRRMQFGKPLDAIPAVRTALARMSVAVTHSAAAVDRAAAAELAAVLARLVTAQGATEAARTAHQLHGAMGTTAEYGLGRYTSRLWSRRDAGTAQADLAAAVGVQVRDGGETALWDSVTAWPTRADQGASPDREDY
jgi:acyl-CoA dehydrogenase